MAVDYTTLAWDAEGQKRYETGVDHVVLYVKQNSKMGSSDDGFPSDLTVGTGQTIEGSWFYNGVAWNGVTSISKSPSGAEANDIYADNIKYASLRSAESFGATIEAYTYPDEFAKCDGSEVIKGGLFIGQQKRSPFGLCFRTDIGDDLDDGVDVNKKFKLHLIYNATASPSESSYSTINDSPEAITFSWEMTTIPADAGTDRNRTAHIEIDVTKLTDYSANAQSGTGSTSMDKFLNILYGVTTDQSNSVAGNTAFLPMPIDVINFFKANCT